MGSHTTTLCGRNAVQVAVRRSARSISRRWLPGSMGWATVGHNSFMLRFATDGFEFTVFPDGRAIIKGTNDVAKARTLYSQYVGS